MYPPLRDTKWSKDFKLLEANDSPENLDLRRHHAQHLSLLLRWHSSHSWYLFIIEKFTKCCVLQLFELAWIGLNQKSDTVLNIEYWTIWIWKALEEFNCRPLSHCFAFPPSDHTLSALRVVFIFNVRRSWCRFSPNFYGRKQLMMAFVRERKSARHNHILQQSDGIHRRVDLSIHFIQDNGNQHVTHGSSKHPELHRKLK
jgi:hypothetical protein